MLHVRTVAARQHLNFAATLRMLAEFLDDTRSARPAVCRLFREKAYRTIDPDFEDLLWRAQARIFAIVLDIGSIPAEPRQNRFSCLGMQTHFSGSVPFGIEALFGFSSPLPSPS